MCRLFMANKKGIEKIKNTLEDFLNQLEKSNGGHGNGLALIKDQQIVLLKKGESYSNEDIIKDIEDNDCDWVIYHTRIASAGGKSAKNCHPYINEKQDMLLAMNGTVSEFSNLAKRRDVTDTQVIAECFFNGIITEEDMLELSSTPRFLGFNEGKVFAVNNGSYSKLVAHTDEDGAILIASESSKQKDNIPWKKMEECVWREGEEIQYEKVKASTTNKTNSYYDNYYYNDYYYSSKKQEFNTIQEYTTYELEKVYDEVSTYIGYSNETLKDIAELYTGKIFKVIEIVGVEGVLCKWVTSENTGIDYTVVE